MAAQSKTQNTNPNKLGAVLGAVGAAFAIICKVRQLIAIVSAKVPKANCLILCLRFIFPSLAKLTAKHTSERAKAAAVSNRRRLSS